MLLVSVFEYKNSKKAVLQGFLKSHPLLSYLQLPKNFPSDGMGPIGGDSGMDRPNLNNDETNPRPCLGYIGDEILPSYIGIIYIYIDLYDDLCMYIVHIKSFFQISFSTPNQSV